MNFDTEMVLADMCEDARQEALDACECMSGLPTKAGVAEVTAEQRGTSSGWKFVVRIEVTRA